MTCDDAFEKLTSPAGHVDAPLRRHLQACARCRDMAETLRPALELLRTEAPLADDAAVAIARRSARRLSRRASETPPPRQQRSWVVATFAAMAGAACCLAAVRLSQSSIPAPHEPCPRHSSETSAWMDRAGVPVTMACIACHPPAGTATTTMIKPVSSL